MDYITTEEGIKLSYILTINDSLSPFLVILIHGTCGHKNNLFFPKLAESIKYNTLRFDLQGNGQSEGDFMIGGFSREVDNIKSVVNWSRSRGFKVLALIGHSKGGNEVLMYSSRYGDVPIVIPITARMDMSILPNFLFPVIDKVEAEGSAIIELAGKEYKIDKEGLKERKSINMRKVLEKVKTWVAISHGTNDDITNLSDSAEIENCLGVYSFERIIIEGADHFYIGKEDELCQHINNFFVKAVPLLVLRGKL